MAKVLHIAPAKLDSASPVFALALQEVFGSLGIWAEHLPPDRSQMQNEQRTTDNQKPDHGSRRFH